MRVILFLLSASLLFGQLDNNSVTLTASRSIPTPLPDQVLLNVTVGTSATATIDDAIAALPGLGITASQLAAVQASSQELDWSFSLTVPLAKLKDTIATLTALQQSRSKPGLNPVLNFSVGG